MASRRTRGEVRSFGFQIRVLLENRVANRVGARSGLTIRALCRSMPASCAPVA